MTATPTNGTIVVATDLQTSGDEATQLAAAWARRVGGRLHLVHVIGEDLAPPEAVDPAVAPAVKAMTERLHARFEEARARLAEQSVQCAGSVETKSTLATGRPWESLIEVAKNEDAGMIVVGPHVRATKLLGRARDRILGSTARRVVRHAGRPVLVATGETDATEKALVAGPITILVGVDLQAGGRAAVAVAQALAARGQVRIVLAHVLKDPFAPDDFPVDWKRVRVAWEENLRAKLEAEHGDLRAELVMLSGMPSFAIAEAAESLGAHLVVVGAHAGGPLSRVLLGSTAERLVEISPVPVLVVPPGDEAEPDGGSS